MVIPRPSLIPLVLREWCSDAHFPREPEPDIVMDNAAHVDAYAESGRGDGIMAAANLFHSARISQLIPDGARVLDLGCGPGTQLVQIAEFNPKVSFIGVDLADNMLASAKRYSASRQVGNIEWRKADICALDAFGDQSFDGVISTMTLHHLPTLDHLRRTFAEIGRLLRPDGVMYLADFGHLKSLKSILFFAYMHRDSLPHEVCLDYERSLRAAFTLDDYRTIAHANLAFEAEVLGTFLVPLMIIVKRGQERIVSDDLRSRLHALRDLLSPRFRRELDELRLFFAAAGLRKDPFA